MSDTPKRLDLRFGSFACSVQGFDDPVLPVQQVLRAIQHMLEETPELLDSGIVFDPETIDQLVDEVARRADVDESDLEITPGLVIVYLGEGRANLDLGQPAAVTAVTAPTPIAAREAPRETPATPRPGPEIAPVPPAPEEPVAPSYAEPALASGNYESGRFGADEYVPEDFGSMEFLRSGFGREGLAFEGFAREAFGRGEPRAEDYRDADLGAGGLGRAGLDVGSLEDGSYESAEFGAGDFRDDAFGAGDLNDEDSVDEEFSVEDLTPPVLADADAAAARARSPERETTATATPAETADAGVEPALAERGGPNAPGTGEESDYVDIFEQMTEGAALADDGGFMGEFDQNDELDEVDFIRRAPRRAAGGSAFDYGQSTMTYEEEVEQILPRPRAIAARATPAEAPRTPDSVFADPMAGMRKPTSPPPERGKASGVVNFFGDTDDAAATKRRTVGNLRPSFELTPRAEPVAPPSDTPGPARVEAEAAPGPAPAPTQPQADEVAAKSAPEPEKSKAAMVKTGRKTQKEAPATPPTPPAPTAATLAEKAGASAVPDLVVSAAAWLALLQGKTAFSRHEVLDAFDSIPGEHEKSTEARIKGFGKAVRNGQVIAVEGGKFSLSEAETRRFEKLL